MAPWSAWWVVGLGAAGAVAAGALAWYGRRGRGRVGAGAKGAEGVHGAAARRPVQDGSGNSDDGDAAVEQLRARLRAQTPAGFRLTGPSGGEDAERSGRDGEQGEQSGRDGEQGERGERDGEEGEQGEVAVDLFAPSALEVGTVGGKTASLARLVRDGYRVPESACITTAVFAAHVAPLAAEIAQLQTLVRDSLNDDGNRYDMVWDPVEVEAAVDARRRADHLLSQMRERVLAAPLSARVRAAIQRFAESLPAGSTLAVRSSAAAEDGRVHSFAGQFESCLNVPPIVDEIEKAVKRCFASVFQPHIFVYHRAAQAATDADAANSGTPLGSLGLNIAVLLQRQISSRASGIVFTVHPVTRSTSEMVVEAVWGQGHGAVSGEITPTRIVVATRTRTVASRTAPTQTHKYELRRHRLGRSAPAGKGSDDESASDDDRREASTPAGLVYVPLTEAERATECISPAMLDALLLQSKAVVRDRRGEPQDIEFCVEASEAGEVLYLVQVRPITTAGSPGSADAAGLAATLAWDPPGPGPWEQDRGHFPRCLSRFMCDYFVQGITEGFRDGFRRYGVLLDMVEVRTVHGVWYQRPRAVGAPPDATGPPPYLVFKALTLLHPQLRERLATGRRAAETKLWRQDLVQWDNEIKPRILQRNRELQAVALPPLTDVDLLKHFDVCYAHLREVNRTRFRLTPAALIPLGNLLALAHDCLREAGEPYVPYEVMALLTGHGRNEDALGVMAASQSGLIAAFKADYAARKLLFDARTAPAARLHRLLNWTGAGTVQKAMRAYVHDSGVGARIVEGYDIDRKTGLEQPDLLLAGIQELLAGPGLAGHATQPTTAADPVLDAFVARLPAHRRDEFRAVFADTAAMNRLRDERSLFTDIWVVGIARRIYLEVGRRLVERRQLPQARLILEAAPDELAPLLRNEATRPSAGELQRRAEFRETVSPSDAPDRLGPRMRPPPPVEWLPATSRPNERAMRYALANIWNSHAGQGHAAADADGGKAGKETVKGIGAATGTVTGIAVVLSGPDEISRVRRGDILVVVSTTSAFNVVLPLLAAIVTDAGGILSHAAIVAREFHVPCVVSAAKATATIRSGDRIAVDGSTGVVTILQRSTVPARPTLKTAQSFAQINVPKFMTKFATPVTPSVPAPMLLRPSSAVMGASPAPAAVAASPAPSAVAASPAPPAVAASPAPSAVAASPAPALVAGSPGFAPMAASPGSASPTPASPAAATALSPDAARSAPITPPAAAAAGDFAVPTYVIRPDQLPAGALTYTQVNERWATKLAAIRRLELDNRWLQEAFSLTAQQLQDQRALFVKHDVKKQGVLDADALLKFFEHMGQKRSLNDVNLIFKEWDLDGDGLCTFAEWVTVVNGLPSQLEPDLYLGNMYNAQNEHVVNALRITHIVNAAPTRAKCAFRDRGVRYLEIAIEDDDKAEVVSHLDALRAFIADARAVPGGAGRVLVHCSMGMSRSAALLMGHYIVQRQWTLSEAFFFVKSCRRVVSPNQNFLRQLLALASGSASPSVADAELVTQTRLRASMVQQLFHVDSTLLGTLEKLFARMSPDGATIGVQDVIRFEDFVLGIRRARDDDFSKEHSGTLRIKYWDIFGNCYVTLPELIANLKGLPSQLIPAVFVGTNFVASDADMLRELRVTHTVDCSLTANRVPVPGIVKLHVPLDDAIVLDGPEVDAMLEPAFALIDNATAAASDSVVLIHDPIGLTKTAVVCICYLMKRRRWTLAQANYYAVSRVRGFNLPMIWALYRSVVNYALFLNPNDVVPPESIFLYAHRDKSD